MNHSLLTKCRAIVATMAIVGATSAAYAQDSGYQAPNFAGIAGHAEYTAQQIPAYPASPLAGGPAAAMGGDFMDAHGAPIVMPASYCQSCNEGYCGPGYGGAGGYGDPMAIDFGGYGQDQCGPHYFDVSADVVFLQANELFDGIGPFASAGVGPAAPRFLDISNNDDEYEPGWQIAARYDIGALAVLEATYMGIYDIGFTESVNSVDVTNPPSDFQLFSPFSNFGTGTLVPGIDDGRTYTVDYQSDLQSTEISYRRYWLGNNPRVSGSWLLGARYLRMTEDLNFNAQALVGAAVATSNRLWSSENDMVGFQFGGDGWICLRQGLRVGGEAKTGIYNNHFKFRHAGDFPVAAGAPADFDVYTKGDQIAFAAESSATVVADILPSWSIRGGYRVLYLNSLATAGASIDTTQPDSTIVGSQGHALYHGFHSGLEYVW